MKSKKILAGALALMFVFGGAVMPKNSAVFDTAVTASAETYGDYEYEVLSDGTIEILDFHGKDVKVTIPAKIAGKAVTSIGLSSFAYCLNLKSVTIPYGVTHIGICAFTDCESLTSITISNSVTSIDQAAFGSCINLTSITIPNSVTSIGEGAFLDCKKLKSITIPASVTSIDASAFGYYHTFFENEKIDGFTIFGSKGSAAEKYAKANGFKFVDINYKGLKGDVNDDGKIDIEDAVQVINHVNGQKALTADETERANVDSNSKVDIEDAVSIIAHVNGVKKIN